MTCVRSGQVSAPLLSPVSHLPSSPIPPLPVKGRTAPPGYGQCGINTAQRVLAHDLTLTFSFRKRRRVREGDYRLCLGWRVKSRTDPSTRTTHFKHTPTRAHTLRFSSGTCPHTDRMKHEVDYGPVCVRPRLRAESGIRVTCPRLLSTSS